MKLPVSTAAIILTFLTSITESAPTTTPESTSVETKDPPNFDGPLAWFNFVGPGGNNLWTFAPANRQIYYFPASASQMVVASITSSSRAFCIMKGEYGNEAYLFGRSTKPMIPPQKIKYALCLFSS